MRQAVVSGRGAAGEGRVRSARLVERGDDHTVGELSEEGSNAQAVGGDRAGSAGPVTDSPQYEPPRRERTQTRPKGDKRELAAPTMRCLRSLANGCRVPMEMWRWRGCPLASEAMGVSGLSCPDRSHVSDSVDNREDVVATGDAYPWGCPRCRGTTGRLTGCLRTSPDCADPIWRAGARSSTAGDGWRWWRPSSAWRGG